MITAGTSFLRQTGVLHSRLATALVASRQAEASWQQHPPWSPCLQVEMDGSHFAKLCRECGLVGGKLTTTAVDIAFSKAKNKARQLPLGCLPSCPAQAGAATASITGEGGRCMSA